MLGGGRGLLTGILEISEKKKRIIKFYHLSQFHCIFVRLLRS